MPRILIYDQLGNEVARHVIDEGQTLVEWMQAVIPDQYQDLPVPPYEALLNGKPWPYCDHHARQLQADDLVEMTLRARELITIVIAVVALVAAAYSYYQVSQLDDNYQNSTPDGASIYNANIRANQIRLNGIVPEVAGSMPSFPDIIAPVFKRFENDKEVLYMLLSRGVGRFNTDNTHLYIGETPLANYNDTIVANIFEPAADVSAEKAAEFWVTSRELGGSSGQSGLEVSWYSNEDDFKPYDLYETYMVLKDGSGGAIASVFDVDEYIKISEGPDDVRGYYKVTAKDAGAPFRMTVQRYNAVVTNYSGVPTFTVDNTWQGFSPSGFDGYTDEEIVVLLAIASEYGEWSNWYELGAQDEPVEAIEVDYRYPRGLVWVNNKNRDQTMASEWAVEVDDGTDQVIHNFTDSAKTHDPLQITWRLDFDSPAPSARVRFRRENQQSGKTWDIDDLEVVRVKAKIAHQASYDDVTVIAIKAVGTNNLSAGAENKFSVRGDSRMLPTLANLKDHIENGTALSYSATSSIARFAAWSMFDLLGAEALASLDWERFNELEALWVSRGDELNGVFTDETTLWEALKIMLGAGMAEPIPKEGAISIVRNDAASASNVAAMHLYTPDIMLDQGVSWGESWYNNAEPDGIDVEIINPDTGKPMMIECRLPGDLGRRAKRLQVKGVTGTPQGIIQAWRKGMRERRRLRYKPAQIDFSTELDALNNRPGDAIAIASDLDAEQYGVVLAVAGDVVTIDSNLEWTSGATHYAAFRKPSGVVSGLYEVGEGASANELQLLSPAALDFTPVLDNSIEPMLFSFGADDSWAAPAIVREISPSGFAQGKPKVAVMAEEFLPEIYADDDNEPS